MNKEIELENTEFYLITNKKRPECLAKRLSRAKTEEEIKKCIIELKEAGRNPSESIEPYVDVVLHCEHDILKGFIEKFHFFDVIASNGKSYRDEIAAALHISADLPSDDIINDLLGWVISKANGYWDKREPAWITRDEFDSYYCRSLSRFKNKLFIETARKDLERILNINQPNLLSRLFVRQLDILSPDEDEDIISEAMIDVICCEYEKTRLADEWYVTKDDLIQFRNNLIQRWKSIFGELKCQAITGENSNERIIGKRILYKTLGHRERLAGQETEEFYLTRGTYHLLADDDDLIIGWHPNYHKLLTKSDNK